MNGRPGPSSGPPASAPLRPTPIASKIPAAADVSKEPADPFVAIAPSPLSLGTHESLASRLAPAPTSALMMPMWLTAAA